MLITRIQASRIDENGIYLEPVLVNKPFIQQGNLVGVVVPEGLYHPRWDGIEWVEGFTQVEIQTLKNTPVPLTEIDQLKKQQADLIFELMMNGVI